MVAETVLSWASACFWSILAERRSQKKSARLCRLQPRRLGPHHPSDRRNFIQHQPIQADLLNCGDEIGKIHRLADITVAALAIPTIHGLLFLRRCEDNDRQ